MAVLTAKGISGVNIELLLRSLVLPRTATRIPGGEFAGSNGDTITVRVPQPGAARTQATPGATITYDDVSEVAVDVSLSHLYHAKLVSDEEMSFDIENFARQVSRVQVAAVAEAAEDEMATVLNAQTTTGTGGTAEFTYTAGDSASAEQAILDAHEALGVANCPSGNRFLAVSPGFAAALLASDKFTRVNESGGSSALRDAVIGRLYGFTIVESNGLTADSAVAYHQSGVAFANRVPVAPRGATSSATASADGIGLRQVFQYVPDSLSDASVVSTFAGSALVDTNRVVGIAAA